MLVNLQQELQFLIKLGYAVTASGQLSQRSDDNSNIWFTPTLDNESVASLDITGKILETSGHVNFATRSLHSAIYRARPDVNAIVHVHPDYTVAWSMLRKPFLFTTQESALFYNDIAQTDQAHLITDDNVDVVVNHLGSTNNLIIHNHGPITVGTTVESAIWRTILLDKICKLNLLAVAAGTPIELDSETLLKNHKFFTTNRTMTYQYRNFKKNYGTH